MSDSGALIRSAYDAFSRGDREYAGDEQTEDEFWRG
jgi:hypothetical protein